MTPTTPIKLGLDFDNTIVCYDTAIAVLAEKLFDLRPEVPRTKLGIRDYLRAEGREPEWTAFQGELYGPGMRHAQPFEGAIETMLELVGDGHQLFIVSHRSRRPYAGESHDLHAAARLWVAGNLQAQGLFGEKMDTAAVHFLESKEEKLDMIRGLSCDFFLDDLPEILKSPKFPSTTQRIIFDPDDMHKSEVNKNEHRVNKWSQVLRLIG